MTAATWGGSSSSEEEEEEEEEGASTTSQPPVVLDDTQDTMEHTYTATLGIHTCYDVLYMYSRVLAKAC